MAAERRILSVSPLYKLCQGWFFRRVYILEFCNGILDGLEQQKEVATEEIIRGIPRDGRALVPSIMFGEPI